MKFENVMEIQLLRKTKLENSKDVIPGLLGFNFKSNNGGFVPNVRVRPLGLFWNSLKHENSNLITLDQIASDA